MSDSPENQVNPEAPATGASASVPEVKVTPGGKSRPSVAGAKRARPAVAPAVKQDAPTIPVGSASEGAQPSAEAPTEGEAPTSSENSEGVAVPSSFDTAEDVRARAKSRLKLTKPTAGALVALCVVFVIVCIYSMTRWVLPQDSADIRGTWTMDGAKNSVVISESQINLAGQADYDYTLDINAKTIQVGFFTKGGSAHYRFSADRQSLAIIESDDLSWTATLADDLAWQCSDFFAMIKKESRSPLGSDEGIVLIKQ